MKRKLAVLFVFAALWSMLGVAAEENQDIINKLPLTEQLKPLQPAKTGFFW